MSGTEEIIDALGIEGNQAKTIEIILITKDPLYAHQTIGCFVYREMGATPPRPFETATPGEFTFIFEAWRRSHEIGSTALREVACDCGNTTDNTCITKLRLYDKIFNKLESA